MDKQIKILHRFNGKDWPKDVTVMLTNAWQGSEKPIKVTVEEYTETRRLAQNKLLFLWHGELSAHIEETTGSKFNSNDIHEYVAENLLSKRVVSIGGEPIIVRAKTSELKVKPFSEFLERYDQWAIGKYNCIFSHPEDLYLKAVVEQGDK